MIDIYDHLKKYHWTSYKNKGNVVIGRDNIFYDLNAEEIITAEQRMGRDFPSQLREFYTTIGYGHLTNSLYDDKDSFIVNKILPPRIAVDYMQGILEHPEDEYSMAESVYEDLQVGDLPFFEIGDSSSFMVMKLNSDNPNAVWYMGAEKIEDAFDRFIYRLYYEGPTYYTKNW